MRFSNAASAGEGGGKPVGVGVGGEEGVGGVWARQPTPNQSRHPVKKTYLFIIL